MMITQFLWNILKYKAFFPGFVTSLFLLLMLQDMLSEKSDFADLMTLKEKLEMRKLQFPNQTDVPFETYQLNVQLSNQLSLDRDVPDTRPPECLTKRYDLSQLPNVSVIIPFHNEAWSMLLRTVHSVVFRTPSSLIGEIILIDDYSDYAYLKQPLENYLNEIPKVRLLKTSVREGLIRARMIGAKQATGRALVFVDAHVEVNHGWLEPLLEAVALDRTRIAIPHIDRISPKDLSYGPWDPIMHGSFDWTMEYVWKRVPDWIEKGRISQTDPILTPTTIGCTLAIDRIYFFELGGLDEGMMIWGGENIEISFRTWICGGSMYIYPCSNIGHMFRAFLPYTFPTEYGGSQAVRKNYERIAEVWMDEFKPFYYAAKRITIPLRTKREKYSLRHRKEIRRKLSCKNFKWYLDNIAKDVVLPRLDSNYQGQIKSVVSLQCLTTDPVSGFVTFSSCDRENRDQYFFYTNQSLIYHNNSHCLSIRNGKEVPVINKCDPSNSNQFWRFIEGYPGNLTSMIYFRDFQHPIGRLESIETSHCITQVTVIGSGEQVPGYTKCNTYEIFQYWVFSYKFDFNFKDKF